MKLFRILLLTACSTSLLLVACKKEEDKKIETLQTAYLSMKPWYYHSAGVDVDQDGSIDFALTPGTLPDCVFDNEYQFTPTGGGTVNDSSFRCDTLPAVKPVNWGFSNNEQSIDIWNYQPTVFLGMRGKFKIHMLNDTAFTVARDTIVSLPMFTQPVKASVVLHLNHR